VQLGEAAPNAARRLVQVTHDRLVVHHVGVDVLEPRTNPRAPFLEGEERVFLPVGEVSGEVFGGPVASSDRAAMDERVVVEAAQQLLHGSVPFGDDPDGVLARDGHVRMLTREPRVVARAGEPGAPG
jgi:hypothetical protein